MLAARSVALPIVPAPGSTPNGVSSMCGTALGSDFSIRSG